ncbi:aminomethyl-transferring glycine dehydrogenase, partial [Pseudomonas sp. BN102]|uniref:aminomethyl-transferring glycine dehydrogenase n=1 Tax=Pseudomonas sp. BN102 TaxID=2567886 RepID=UPI00245615B8
MTRAHIPLGTDNEFIARHIGPRDADITAMLALTGHDSLDALMASVIPESIKGTSVLDLPAGQGEAEALAAIKAIAAKNQLFRNHIGQGYYPCHTPTPILRNLLENPAWYTAYTPYQPEISQGRLEALLNFQTLVSDLTGMEIANASLLDEATAAAEAMTFCKRLSKNKAPAFFASVHCHPQTLDVLRTRAEPLGIEVVIGEEAELSDLSGYFGLLLQYPASTGDVPDHRALVQRAHGAGALVAVAADLLALTLLTPPGEFGADLVLGSAQRFGVPLGFGGPHAAYFATRDAFKRDMPGRLVGISIDRHGKPALRLAMQTREQHIRREKATSNICTAQVLLANIASMYAVYHGPQGLAGIARRVHRLTSILAQGLAQLGHRVEQYHFFDTLSIVTARPVDELHAAAHAARINLRALDEVRAGVSMDETCDQSSVEALWAVFAGDGQALPDFAALTVSTGDCLPLELLRESPFLQHEVFNRYHSETELMRYLRKLADKDLALDRSMIPLGSCTMKLNAASEMIPVTWAEFGALHPFAPAEQSAGYLELTSELEAMLCKATGYDAVSLQPNAGSQGEYAGLLAIRAYHASRGEGQRDICLIPQSAHGTNPATAQMAGMRVVVTACDARGNVDIADLKAKAEEHKDRLAALMITYPSTHGVFEEGIREICDIIHANGGQVYIDGANMNAMVGLCAPGQFGGDVSHLNLHKTFCIPHGGGGPGVGPIGVKAHLAPFLPGHAHMARKEGAVSAAPFGSASILPITWMYIRMMGGEGLKRASQLAILSANYIARRLEEHYPVLYTGENGLVAHECILDLRPLKESSGISVDDVAKR